MGETGLERTWPYNFTRKPAVTTSYSYKRSFHSESVEVIHTLFRAAAVDAEVELTIDDIKTVNSAEGKERQVVIVECSPRGQ